MKHELRPAQIEDRQAIVALLSDCDLPFSDVSADKLASFFVAEAAGRIVGVAALEYTDAAGLLRSVAVAPQFRGGRIGEDLVTQCEAKAQLSGVETIYLLTTTAAAYFRRLGYADVPREKVPAAIAAHVQFRSLCPSSAQCLGKRLR